MVPVFVKGALERGVSLSWAARLMAYNPARHFRIDHEKGALEIGKHADIAVLTPEEFIFDASRTGNNVVGWSPYDGMRLPYRVAATYARGRLAFDGASVVAAPGSGRFVRPPESLSLPAALR
jgi:allantoinase